MSRCPDTTVGKIYNIFDSHFLYIFVKTVRETKDEKLEKLMTIKQKTKKPLEKFHLTAVINRTIHYPDKKTGIIKYSYKEEDHVRPLTGHDTLYDSRVVEATSRKEAEKMLNETIDIEQVYEEYSGSARTVIDSVHFIDDPVVDSQITSSDTRHMPLRQFTHLDYDFTTEEKKYLSTKNTVIDNLIGVYGKELKLNKDKLIKLNKNFMG